MIVNDKIIIELKSAECLMKEHELQLINYLKATDIEVGLLFNFGKNLRSEGKFSPMKIIIDLRKSAESMSPVCY